MPALILGRQWFFTHFDTMINLRNYFIQHKITTECLEENHKVEEILLSVGLSKSSLRKKSFESFRNYISTSGGPQSWAKIDLWRISPEYATGLFVILFKLDKVPKKIGISFLQELVKKIYPNESVGILDARCVVIKKLFSTLHEGVTAYIQDMGIPEFDKHEFLSSYRELIQNYELPNHADPERADDLELVNQQLQVQKAELEAERKTLEAREAAVAAREAAVIAKEQLLKEQGELYANARRNVALKEATVNKMLRELPSTSSAPPCLQKRKREDPSTSEDEPSCKISKVSKFPSCTSLNNLKVDQFVMVERSLKKIQCTLFWPAKIFDIKYSCDNDDVEYVRVRYLPDKSQNSRGNTTRIFSIKDLKSVTKRTIHSYASKAGVLLSSYQGAVACLPLDET